MDLPATSTTLLHALRLRETDAWSRFTTAYGPLIDFWVSRLGLSQHDCEDVTQEVFVAATESFESYQHSPAKIGSLRAWLYGITRNKVADWYRRHPVRMRARGGACDHLQQLSYDEFSTDDHAAEQKHQKLVARAIGLLESDFQSHTWQAFWRTAIGGEKSTDVAGDLGMTSKAVRQARYRVLQHLRAELGSDLDVAKAALI